MKILSFDVGIKNLAYCLLEVNNGLLIIHDWKILDLCTENNNFCCKCNISDKPAKYSKNDLFYCKIHAKKEELRIPTDQDNFNLIKKYTLTKLKEKALEYDISHNQIKKEELLDKIKCYLDANFFNIKKEEKADDFNTVELGISLKKNLDKIDFSLSSINYILIENQISPIANRMKTIQGMLTQYFIMKNFNNIQFISSQNKLKYFLNEKNTSYNERKKIGIETCKNLLIKNNLNYIEFFNRYNKKDDLADSFLQGYYFFIHNKYLNI